MSWPDDCGRFFRRGRIMVPSSRESDRQRSARVLEEVILGIQARFVASVRARPRRTSTLGSVSFMSHGTSPSFMAKSAQIRCVIISQVLAIAGGLHSEHLCIATAEVNELLMTALFDDRTV